MRSVDAIRRAGTSDSFLVEECAEFLHMLASYVADCNALEAIESSAAGEQDIADVQRHIATARRRWRSALHRLGARPARSGLGLLAKGGAIQEYLTEFPVEDGEAMTLIGSLLADLRRVFEDAGQVPSNP